MFVRSGDAPDLRNCSYRSSIGPRPLRESAHLPEPAQGPAGIWAPCRPPSHAPHSPFPPLPSAPTGTGDMLGTCAVRCRKKTAPGEHRAQPEGGGEGRFSHPGAVFRRRALGVQPNGHHPSLSLLGEFRWSHGVRRQRLRRADCCEKHRNGGVAATHQNAPQLVRATEGLQLRRASHLRCPAASVR